MNPQQPRRAFALIALAALLLVHVNFAMAAGDFVVPVSINNLIRNPADLFDLQGKTVRFTPLADGAYKVQNLRGAEPVSCNQKLEDFAAIGPWYAKGWNLSLPFAFPFGGQSWKSVYVNMDGNISFEKPESEYWPARNPWADAGMYSVAAAIDSRSAAGFEKMIAVFWGPYQDQITNNVSIRVQRDSVAITWNMRRAPWGQAVLGSNTFQARLYASGVIEFTYPRVAERDGIVGLFTGKAVSGTRLSRWEFKGKAPHPGVDIESGEVYDAGTVLDLVITMRRDAITQVDAGPLDYRAWVDHDGVTDLVTVSVAEQQRMACWLGAAPLTGGWQISGKGVHMFVSKVLLADCKKCSVGWNVNWNGIAGRFVGSGTESPVFDMSQIPPASIKLSQAQGNEAQFGNIFEVFHYPVVTKASERLLESIYKVSPSPDDIALVFTDFRIDDLYGQGAGAIAANFGIEGIGKENEKPRSTRAIGSTQLQMSVATVWLGSPKFDETGSESDGTRWVNFAHGIKWLAHECTHRWGMNLRFENSVSGKEESLVDGVGHWREGLDTTAAFPVSDMFLEHPAIGGSIMGGFSWKRNRDGTFSPTRYSFQVPAGYSPLDLYVMGMLPPERVPDTFLLEDFKDLALNHFQGTSTPVRIGDIERVMGKRLPTCADAQKIFHMTVYLAHEPDRNATAAMLTRARRLSAVLSKFFLKATGGAMRVVPVEP